MIKFYFKGTLNGKKTNGVVIRVNKEQALAVLQEIGIELDDMKQLADDQNVYTYRAMGMDGVEYKDDIIAKSSGAVNKYLKKMDRYPLAINTVKEFKNVPKEMKEQVQEVKKPKTKVIFSFTIFGFRFTLERLVK
jgi:uncharacterized protein YdgA (DUF945 family)